MTIWAPRMLFALAVVLLPAAAGAAPRVVITRGVYTSVFDDRVSASDAARVQQRAIAAARDAGWDPIDGGDCAEVACLDALRATHGADDALAVSTRQSGAQYEFAIVSGREGRFDETFTGAALAALDQLDQLVARYLADWKPPAPAATPESQPAEAHAKSKPASKKPVSLTAFKAGIAVTGILSATLLMLEVAHDVKRQKLLDTPIEDRDSGDRDTVQHIQIAGRVFFAATLAGAVTTTVLGFFTDFDRKVAVAPVAAAGGAGLALTGEF